MIKRITSGISAFVMSLSALAVLAPAIASAAVDVCTWTGTAGDRKFSTVGNWDCATDTGSAPGDGDSIILPYSAAINVSSQPLDQDISGLSIANISLTGDAGTTCSGGYKGYVVTGSALTLTGGIDYSAATGNCWGGSSFEVSTLTIAATNFTIASGSSPATYMSLGEYGGSSTLALGTSNLVYTGAYGPSIVADITGSGDISSENGGVLNGDNSEFTGDIIVSSGVIWFDKALSLGSGTSPIVIGDGVSIGFGTQDAAATSARPITLNGASYGDSSSKLSFSVSQGCEGQVVPDITLSGTFTLGADATFYSNCSAKLIISNPTLNGHTLTATSGNLGTVVVGTTEIKPTYKETVITDDLPEQALYVVAYDLTVLNGTRGYTAVSNFGILKGTGKMGELIVYKGGVIAPGLSPGCLSSGNLELYGEYQFETKGTTACTDYDQLKVTGTVRLTQDTNEEPDSGTLKVDFLDKYNPAAGVKFVIIENDGTDAVEGTFKDLAEGATFKGPNNSVLKVSYKGGDGNDVEVTVVTAGTPDTGFGLLLNNPAGLVALTTLAAGVILAMSRRMKPATKRARR